MSRKAELAELLRDYPPSLTKSFAEAQAEREDILQGMRECDAATKPFVVPTHYPIYPRKLPWEGRLENED